MGKIRKAKHGPEYHIQADLIKYLTERGWLVERMHGNAFQKGIPDLYIHHPEHDYRWIDVKRNDGGYSFTEDQRRKWPIWDKFGVGIWIIRAANQEEYDKLFQPPNWRHYWKPQWGEPGAELDIEALLSELDKNES